MMLTAEVVAGRMTVHNKCNDALQLALEDTAAGGKYKEKYKFTYHY